VNEELATQIWWKRWGRVKTHVPTTCQVVSENAMGPEHGDAHLFACGVVLDFGLQSLQGLDVSHCRRRFLALLDVRGDGRMVLVPGHPHTLLHVTILPNPTHEIVGVQSCQRREQLVHGSGRFVDRRRLTTTMHASRKATSNKQTRVSNCW
jgi:hypothetical protein